LTQIAKDWANSVTPVKGRTVRSKFGPSNQLGSPSAHPSRQASARLRVVSQSEAPLLSSSSRTAWPKPDHKQAEGEDASSTQQQPDKQQQQPRRAVGTAAREAARAARQLVVAAPAQAAVVMQAAGIANQQLPTYNGQSAAPKKKMTYVLMLSTNESKRLLG